MQSRRSKEEATLPGGQMLGTMQDVEPSDSVYCGEGQGMQLSSTWVQF